MALHAPLEGLLAPQGFALLLSVPEERRELHPKSTQSPTKSATKPRVFCIPPASGRDVADPIPKLDKPEIAIGAGGDDLRRTIWSGEGELREGALQGQAPNLAAPVLSKPEITIGAAGDPERAAVLLWERELRDLAGGGDASDPVAKLLGKPEVAVGTAGDARRLAPRRRERKLGDGA